MRPYIDSYVSFQIMSSELNLPQVDIQAVETSEQMISGNRMRLSSVLNVMQVCRLFFLTLSLFSIEKKLSILEQGCKMTMCGTSEGL